MIFARVIMLPLFSLWAASSAWADATPVAITVTTTAEVEHKSVENGRLIVQLVPADRVVAGDAVVYTVEARNTSAQIIPHPEFVAAIPEHMTYVPDSAVGPGAIVSYSVDGGASFDSAANLRAAKRSAFTHIRFQLRHPLKPDSVAFARFRAVLN